MTVSHGRRKRVADENIAGHSAAENSSELDRLADKSPVADDAENISAGDDQNAVGSVV